MKIENLKYLKSLLWYDEPITSLFKDTTTNKLYIIHNVKSLATKVKAIIFEVTEKELEIYLNSHCNCDVLFDLVANGCSNIVWLFEYKPFQFSKVLKLVELDKKDLTDKYTQKK